MNQTWIWEEKLRPLFEITSNLVGYKFEESDWTAVRYGVQNTNVESNNWYEYLLVGDDELTIKIACDEETSVIFVRVESNSDTRSQISLVLHICQNYHFRAIGE